MGDKLNVIMSTDGRRGEGQTIKKEMSAVRGWIE